MDLEERGNGRVREGNGGEWSWKGGELKGARIFD